MFQSATALFGSVREKIPAFDSTGTNCPLNVDASKWNGFVPHVCALKHAPPPSKKIISFFEFVALGETPMPVGVPSRHEAPGKSTHVHAPGVRPVIGTPGLASPGASSATSPEVPPSPASLVSAVDPHATM